jgi:phytoene dehydrogenase-like protein
VKIPFLIIGSGLSGIAAAIRFSRYFPDVLLLEKHSRVGGLNSYYYRNNTLFETGLHAITNYAKPNHKKAPLNRLLRQLKLSRYDFQTLEQIQSEIRFINNESLLFSNDFDLFRTEVKEKFPHCSAKFDSFIAIIDNYDPFTPKQFISARAFLHEHLQDELLINMVLCPLLYYGSSLENDIDLDQFVIMFRAIFQEGMFRPAGSMKDFLDTLLQQYKNFGGELRLKTKVTRILHQDNTVTGIQLEGGEIIECNHILSTIGYEETLELLGTQPEHNQDKRLGFLESIFQFPSTVQKHYPCDKTIIFYNRGTTFNYQRPADLLSLESGVICFPSNFQNRKQNKHFEIRATHLSSYSSWEKARITKKSYQSQKNLTTAEIRINLENIVGDFENNIVYEDTFTPITIEKFTAKKEGAIYGNPKKFKEGELGYKNLFLAGTDQGLLGIVGSMLSGVTMVNQHILPKF